MQEIIQTGKKFRILKDATSRIWHVISFWTKAQDVEFNNGQNEQTTLGNITGISDSLTSTSSNVAASAKAVKALNDKIVNQVNNLNGQITQKDQTISNLNSQISQKDQTITNLQKQVNELNNSSIKLENVTEYITLNYRDVGPITLTKNSYVSMRGFRQITNHDNSSEGHIAIAVIKNGTVLNWKKQFIGEFGGGKVEIAWDGKGKKGDTFEIQFKDLNEQPGSTWFNPDPEAGKDHIKSYAQITNRDIVAIGAS